MRAAGGEIPLPVAKETASALLGELFGRYREAPTHLPERVRAHFAVDGEARAVCDYVAGMTDRFALKEHRALTGRDAGI